MFRFYILYPVRALLYIFFMLYFTFSLTAQTGSGSSGSLSKDWYQSKIIKNITFDGLKHIKYSDLEGIIDPYIGKPYNDSLFWELQGRLYELEYFDTISPSALPSDEKGSELILKFTVKERPIISKIEFNGNSGLKTSELREVIRVKANDIYNQSKIQIDERALFSKYVESGYPDVVVRSETKTNKDGTVIVLFAVNEGERITVVKINFEGNERFSSKTLRNQISLSEKRLLNSGAFQEAKLNADRRAITQYYHDRGYIDAQVTDVIRETSRDEKGVQLTLIFKIFEGKIYLFEGVTFEGNKIFSTAALSALIRSKRGQVLNEQRMQTDLMRVSDLYYENGYIYNTITPVEKRNVEQGMISYTVKITERDRAYVEHIIIKGNKKTKDNVIIREIPLEPGDIFSKSKILEGYRNLYNLQYFSSVIPDTPPGSVDGLLDLIVTVEEQPTTDVQAGLTFSGTSDPNSFPMSVMVKLTDRNFMGNGNIFGVEGNLSPDLLSLSVNYTKRWLFGLPLSGGFDMTYQYASRLALMNNHPPLWRGDEDYAYPDGFPSYEDYINSDRIPSDEYLFTYKQQNISLGFSTGYRWGTPFGILGLGGGPRVGFKYNDYDRERFRAFDRALRERNSWTPASSISLSVSLDQRDVYYDPSKGYYLSQRLGFYGLLPDPLEEEYFTRSDSKAECFFTLWNLPVSDKWAFKGVFGIHTGFLYILPQLGMESPVIEQANMLAIDGMFIGRGWQDQRSVRGFALWENWAELRIPLVPNVLSVDGFFDAAEVASKPSKLFSDDNGQTFAERMRFSFGGGLRFAIPQFPFRFLFAKRFKIVDGQVQFMPGSIGGDGKKGGVDFVLSFAISTY